MAAPNWDTLTWDAVDDELNGDVDTCGNIGEALNAGPDAWETVGDWTRELLLRFPALRADDAFHVACVFYFTRSAR